MKTQSWLCMYDIKDKKRLARVHKLLSGYGVAVGYSVFYLQMPHEHLQTLSKRLYKLTIFDDNVRLYACDEWQALHQMASDRRGAVLW